MGPPDSLTISPSCPSREQWRPPCGVEHLGGYRLRLTFADGLTGDVDLIERLSAATGPMFEPLKEVAYFASVSVDPELGTVVWPNGADLAPEVLHEQALNLA